MNIIKELILIREEELMNNNYSFDFTMYCKKIWKEYLNFSLEYDINEINYDIENKFLEKKYNLKLQEYNGKLQKHPLNALNILNDFNTFNANKKLKSKCELEIKNDSFKDELIKYCEYCKNILNNCDSTIKDKIDGANYFIQYIQCNNISSLEDITKDTVLNYINSYNDCIKSRKIYLNYTLRNFLNYLFLENIIKYDFSFLIPPVKRNCVKNPKPFEKEDVIKILNYLKEHRVESLVGYRNYVIILIAAKTGLRKIDILNLKYNHINWETNEICLVQQKTKKSVKIPLSPDVGNAIIEYIKNERPFKLKNNDDYIFIKNQYSLEKLSSGYSLTEYIKNAMIKCNIDYKKYKKIGLHSFRFTLATEMLNNEISLDIISSCLGHSNTNSTNAYLKCNEKNLSKCMVVINCEL